MRNHLIIILIINFVFMQNPKSIDEFTNLGFKGVFIGWSGEMIKIKLESGQIIYANFSEIEFGTLVDWSDSTDDELRKLFIKYTNEHGVSVTNLKAEVEFKLSGVLNPHPIDLGLNVCENKNPTMMGYNICKGLAIEAWKKEINRAISNLEKLDDGKYKKRLEESQSSWNEYINIHDEYLTSLSGFKDHVTTSRISHLNHQLNLIRNRAHELQSIILDF